MGTIHTGIQGENKLAKRRGFSARVERVQKETQQYILTYERAICPVLTGNMKSTIEPIEEGNTRGVAVGGDEAPYAPLVNDGTDKMASQPFHDEAAQAGRKYQNEQYKGL